MPLLTHKMLWEHQEGDIKRIFVSENRNELSMIFARYSKGLSSSVCVVGCAFIMAVSVYQISKTKAKI